jgi:long-subunit acyl-CoA synthetase (AMP-forming)
MKRAVLCVPNPQDYIDQLDDYSIMIVNPASTQSRIEYLLDHADWSLKITATDVEHRSGGDYGNERLFWYTSGTTGDSKFCSFTQAQLDIMCNTIIKDYQLDANDRYVSIMPLWHAHGQGFFWATKRAGCEVNFVTVQTLRQIPLHAPTFITAVPDMLKIIRQFKFDHLRFVRSASAPLSNDMFLALKQQYQVPVIEAFGMTESLSHCFTNPLHGEQRMGTVGLPSGIDADIVDGKLLIRGSTVFQSDWYDTGDLATRDELGYYVIQGRSRDQINVKGIKINPVSVEQQVKKMMPQITDIVIFGNESFNCVYVGDVELDRVTRALQSIHSACFPNMIQQLEFIPDSGTGKKSRIWLCKYFDCK